MGVKICPECGGKVSESRNTCIHCGYIFPSEKPKETKKCPDCEADVDIDVNECPECGSEHIQRLRRVTGYLTGDYKTAFNIGKQHEVEERFKHSKQL